MEVVGKEGTVVMPAYSCNRTDVAKDEEDIKMGVSCKCKILPYDPAATPCWTGKICDTFWRRKGVLRSADPTHSLAAFGKKAEEIIAKAESRWGKLLELDGFILLLGVGLSSCSSMHLAEHKVQLPKHIQDKIVKPFELLKKYPPEEWIMGYGPYPKFAVMDDICRQHVAFKETMIGDALVKFFRLKEVIDLYANELQNNPDKFYIVKGS